MRIALTADPFIPVPPENYGGIERIIAFLAEGLQARNHDVILVAHAASQVNVPLIKYPTFKSGVTGHIKNIKTVHELRFWKPDLIHSFSRLAYLMPFFRSSIPKIMSYQREPTIEQIKKGVMFSKKGTLSFTGCSDYISNRIAPFAKAITVYNGVKKDTYQFKNKVAEDSPFVFLGRVEEIKGPHIAIEIAKKTGIRLIIAGNIPEDEQSNTFFKKQVAPHVDNDFIKYIGPVNDTQKNGLLGTARAFLMPILWDEPFGIVMAEAMACGTPILGLHRGSVPEVVKQGITGFYANTVEELIEYCAQLESINRQDVYADFIDRFSADVIIEEYLNVYRRVVN